MMILCSKRIKLIKTPFYLGHKKMNFSTNAINVQYVDSLPDDSLVDRGLKIVVAIHGNPGHCKHFSGLVDYFAKNGSNVRVIALNMPDFSITRKTMAFWHSNEERTQFIRDFLNAMNISTVDCLISHSAGIQPISLLWSDPKPLTIRSIGIFNPQYISQKYFTLQKCLSFLSQYRLGIAWMDLIRPHVLMKGRTPMNYDSVDEVLHFILVHSYINNSVFYKRLDVLKALNIPTLLVYGESDKLIRKELYEEMAQRLGADQKDLVIYGEDNSLEKDSERQHWLRVLVLKGGGHFAFAKYTEEVCKQLAKHCLQSKL